MRKTAGRKRKFKRNHYKTTGCNVNKKSLLPEEKIADRK